MIGPNGAGKSSLLNILNGVPFLILSLAGLGLNLLTGYAGQLSLGAGAFMMVGAYGRTEATDGRVFPYIFPVMVTFYSEASAVVNYIAEKERGFDKLKGEKIETVYHDSAYGHETLDPLALLAEKYGFENIHIPVADPGSEQSSQWRPVRERRPDWVFLRTWGVSTPVAIKTAQRFGFPADRIIGDVWASSEEDVSPAGDAAKGYLALTPYPAGADFEIHKRLKQHIIDTGKSDLRDPKAFGSVYYNSGLVNALISVEIVRQAQAKFSNGPITGEEGQWALAQLNALRSMGTWPPGR